jgi:hypothetical protein
MIKMPEHIGWQIWPTRASADHRLEARLITARSGAAADD